MSDGVEYVSMPDGLDYILRPVLRGLCKYESLKDCTLSLFDISVLNDALDCSVENERRQQESAKK